MKKLITILLLSILTITVNAQTTLETAVLKELNTYRTNRAKKPLCALKIDNSLSIWSAYHAKYLTKVNKLRIKDTTGKPHDEKINISDWKELTFDQRNYEFNKTYEDKHISKGEVQIREISFKEGTSEVTIAKAIIQNFHNSPDHKEIINSDYDTRDGLPIVGISVIKEKSQIGGDDVYTVVIDLGIKFN